MNDIVRRKRWLEQACFEGPFGRGRLREAAGAICSPGGLASAGFGGLWASFCLAIGG